MIKKNDFAGVAAALAAIVKRQGPRLKRVGTAGNLSWYTPDKLYKGKPLYAAGVKINKNYVSFHFMPVYMFPELSKGMSPALKRRLGKGCFDFDAVDDELFTELSALVKAGFERFKTVKTLKRPS
jgi:hypothetical protein